MHVNCEQILKDSKNTKRESVVNILNKRFKKIQLRITVAHGCLVEKFCKSNILWSHDRTGSVPPILPDPKEFFGISAGREYFCQLYNMIQTG